ncbi:hypothetical protein STEG23_031468 [Scotinomys teguina]
MARKAGQGKEEEESRARQQEEKTPVREEEEKPACHGGAHHVVEQGPKPQSSSIMDRSFQNPKPLLTFLLGPSAFQCSVLQLIVLYVMSASAPDTLDQATPELKQNPTSLEVDWPGVT